MGERVKRKRNGTMTERGFEPQTHAEPGGICQRLVRTLLGLPHDLSRPFKNMTRK